MDYKKTYDSIIKKALLENRKKSKEHYFENHHIMPRCLGGLNDKSNMVLLTAKEHFVCHKLLFFMNPTNKKLAMAFHVMVCGKNKKEKINLSARDFELTRIAARLASSGKNNPRYGVILSNETKERISKALKGLPSSNKGIKHSDSTRMKISIANKGKLLGVKKSEETRRRMSLYQKSKPFGPTKGKIIMNRRKPISAKSPSGEIIEFIGGATEMEQKFGLKKYNIGRYLRGRCNNTEGWTEFKYLEKKITQL